MKLCSSLFPGVSGAHAGWLSVWFAESLGTQLQTGLSDFRLWQDDKGFFITVIFACDMD